MSTNSDDLFEKKDPDTKPDDQVTVDPMAKYADLLKAIKNDDGNQKYESLDKALEALVHSQSYIPKLKTELSEKEKRLAEVEQMLTQSSSIEDLLTRLTEKKDEGQGNPPVTSGLDEQAVAKLLEEKLAQREITARAEANMSKFSQAIKGKFGDKAPEEIQKVASENGLTLDFLKQLATQSPDAALKFFNTSAPKGATPTTGGLNVPPLNSGIPEIKRPERSALSGPGAGKDAVELMRQIKEQTLEKARQGYYQ